LVGATAPFSKPDGHPDAGNVTLFDALGELTDSVLLQAAAVHGKGPPHNLRPPRKIPNRRSGLAVLQPGQHFIAASGLQETRVWRNESTFLASMMMDPRGWKMVQDSTTWCWSFDEDHPLKFIWTKTKTGPFIYICGTSNRTTWRIQRNEGGAAHDCTNDFGAAPRERDSGAQGGNGSGGGDTNLPSTITGQMLSRWQVNGDCIAKADSKQTLRK